MSVMFEAEDNSILDVGLVPVTMKWTIQVFWEYKKKRRRNGPSVLV